VADDLVKDILINITAKTDVAGLDAATQALVRLSDSAGRSAEFFQNLQQTYGQAGSALTTGLASLNDQLSNVNDKIENQDALLHALKFSDSFQAQLDEFNAGINRSVTVADLLVASAKATGSEWTAALQSLNDQLSGVNLKLENEQEILAALKMPSAEPVIEATTESIEKLNVDLQRTNDFFQQMQILYGKLGSTGSFAPALSAGVEHLNAELSRVNETVVNEQRLLDQLAGGYRATYGATQQQVDAVDDLANAFRNDQLQEEIDEMVRLQKATDAETEAATRLKAEWDEIIANNTAASIGYGKEGGLIGPALPGAEDEDKLKSLFGAARGVRGGAQLANLVGAEGLAGGLTGAADLTYFAEGLRQINDVVAPLNASLEVTGGLLPALTADLVAANIPMAGLIATLLPLATVVAGVVIVVTQLNAAYQQQLESGQKVLDANLKAQQEYYQDVSTLTNEQTKDRIAQLQTEGATSAAIQKENFNGIIRQFASSNFGGDIDKASEYLKSLGGDPIEQLVKNFGLGTVGLNEFTDSTKQLYDAYKTAKSDSDTASASITRLNQGLTDNAFAANTAADAAQRKAQFDLAQAQEVQGYDKQTRDSLQQTLSLKQQDIVNQKAYIATLEANGAALDEAAKHGENVAVAQRTNDAAIEDHKKQIDADTVAIQHITDVSLGLADARSREEERAKALEKALNDAVTAQERYANSVEAAKTQLENQSINALTKFGLATREFVEGSIQDVEARFQIASKEDQAEVKIHADTAQAIEEIELRHANAVQDANKQLLRQQYDDTIKTQNEQQKLRLDVQHQEENAAIQHEQKLDDLRKKRRDDEIWDLLNGNFLALYKDQFQKQQAVDQETERYAREKTLRDVHTRQTLENQALAMQQERAQQILANGRKLEDLQTAEDREIAAKQDAETRKIQIARDSETQQLIDLNHNEEYKRRLIAVNFGIELQMYQQQEQQRLKILEDEKNRLLAQSTTDINAAGGYGRGIRYTPTLDAGGSAGPGESFLKGPLSEQLNFGNKAFNLAGQALVYPLSNVNVTPNKSGPSGPITIGPIIINESQDSVGTQQAVKDGVAAALQDYFR